MRTTQTGIPFVLCVACGVEHPATRTHCTTCGRASLFLEPASGRCLSCREVS